MIKFTLHCAMYLEKCKCWNGNGSSNYIIQNLFKNKFKPNEIHFEMNNDLEQTNPKGVYVTSIIGCYNSKTDTVELSNAGHLPAYLELMINLQSIIHLLYLLS